MINICVFIRTLLVGGAEKQAILLAKALNLNYVVYLVVWHGNHTESKYLKFADENNINVVLLEGNIIVRFCKLVSFLKKRKINIILSSLASNNFYGSLAGKLGKVKFLIGGIRAAKISYFKFIVKRFFHNHVLDYTIFNNYSGKDELIFRGFNSVKCVVIPNCFELESKLIIKEEKKVINIVTVGRFVVPKDYPTAINSINFLVTELLKNSDFKIHYFIIGYGILEENIRIMISDLHLENMVTIIINPINISEYLSNADIYLSTSIFEGTSNSILEAMSLSLPIVATDAGDNRFLVEKNISGYICNVGDYEQVANKIYSLVTDYSKRMNFSIASYNKLKSNYTMEIFRNNYLDFIEKLVSNKT